MARCKDKTLHHKGHQGGTWDLPATIDMCLWGLSVLGLPSPSMWGLTTGLNWGEARSSTHSRLGHWANKFERREASRTPTSGWCISGVAALCNSFRGCEARSSTPVYGIKELKISTLLSGYGIKVRKRRKTRIGCFCRGKEVFLLQNEFKSLLLRIRKLSVSLPISNG